MAASNGSGRRGQTANGSGRPAPVYRPPGADSKNPRSRPARRPRTRTRECRGKASTPCRSAKLARPLLLSGEKETGIAPEWPCLGRTPSLRLHATQQPSFSALVAAHRVPRPSQLPALNVYILYRPRFLSPAHQNLSATPHTHGLYRLSHHNLNQASQPEGNLDVLRWCDLD